MDPALYKAATRGNVATLRQLLFANPRILELTTPLHNTALHLAALHGQTDVAREVLNAKEDLLVASNADGDTPLHLAARAANNPHVAELLVRRASTWQEDLNNAADMPLISSRSPLNMTNSAGNTPLHEAVRHRRSAMALLLLDADPNRGHDRNMLGQSPLDMAARGGLVQVVQRIADIPWVHSQYIPSIHGTALHQAVLGGHRSAVEIVSSAMDALSARDVLAGGRPRILEILLDKLPWLMELTDSNGNNALHYAARKDYIRAVELVLNKCTELAYKVNREQQSPLHVAALYGSLGTIKVLLQHCPDVAEMVDNAGQTAFHVSVASGKTNALSALLRHIHHGELLNRTDKDGNTPLHLATIMSPIQSALLLIEDKRIDPCVLNRNGQTARNLFEINCAGREMDVYELSLRYFLLHKESVGQCCNQPMTRLPFSNRSRALNKQVADIHLIIATLVATVSFAAIFTMPGGYNQIEGTAIHGRSSTFKIFLISDTISMCSSSFVLLSYLAALQDPFTQKQELIVYGSVGNIIACLSMLVSFVAAACITIEPQVRWPAYVVISIVASTPLATFIVVRLTATFASSPNFLCLRNA